MVVDGHAEVHHRVRDVPVPGPGVGVPDQTEGHEVPHGGVGVLQVGLDDHDRLPVGVIPGEELVVPLQLGLHGQVVARARLALLLQVPPVVPVAGAHVSVAHLEQLAGVVVVQGEPLGLDERLVAFDTQPIQVLRDHVVGVGIDLLRVGVLEPQDEVPAVPLDVLVVEDRHAGVPDVQGPGGSGRDAHDDLPVNVLEFRELVDALLLLLDEKR